MASLINQLFGRRSIATVLLVAFLAMGLLPLVAVSLITHINAATSVIQEKTSDLKAVSLLKADDISQFFNERKRNVSILADNPLVSKAMKTYTARFDHDQTAQHQNSAINGRYRDFFSRLHKKYGYYDLFLIAPGGDIVFSVTRESDFGTNLNDGAYNDTELADVFAQAKNSRQAKLSGFRFYAPSQEPAAFVAAPVFEDQRFIGVLALQINNQRIFELASDYTGLGETGEMVLAAKSEESALFVAPLRHDPDAAFNRRVSLGSDMAVPIQKAVQDESGAGVFKDYRGREVISAWRHISGINLGMVVKIDAAEAFSQVTRIRNWSLLIGFLAVAGVILTALGLSKWFAAPIRELKNGAVRIGQGDLDYKVGINRNDEIGELSRTFDEMTKNLKKTMASRDELAAEIERRKKLEAELKRSNQDLEQFAYVASHDLQEPLRMVSSYTQLLGQRYRDQLDDKAKKFIDYAVDGAVRMQGLINDLLAYSRVTTRGGEFADTDSGKALAQALADLKASIKETEAEVTYDELPEVNADASQLIRVFQNLISNAIKYRGPDPPKIHVFAQKSESRWIFSVTDNSMGIDPKHQERIFTIFQRLHGQQYSGTGMGLSMCKRIVERHGGDIWVESEPGKGATFYFTLPQKKGNREDGSQ
ncbi:MAG: ATP-binding protein [Desulfobacterales bacterium]